ncbi:MAG: hypothetical protein JWQ59_894 [Cryobacterium sp.]|jgi:hypothetical protein|nr:hypothetical protein [Cryobacterium sp.]
MAGVDYFNTFIAVAPDSTAVAGIIPSERGGRPTVALRTWQLIAGEPYRHTSGDVIFTVYAERAGVPEADLPAAREEYFSIGRACLRSSDLGKKYGWGIHADAGGRIALYPIGSPEYEALAAGTAPSGEAVATLRAMRSKRG